MACASRCPSGAFPLSPYTTPDAVEIRAPYLTPGNISLRLDPRSHEQGLVVGDLLAQGDGELLGGVADELLAHLVETLAHKLAMLLLAEFNIAWIKLSVNKPGAIRGSRDVGVEIVRHKSQVAAG